MPKISWMKWLPLKLSIYIQHQTIVDIIASLSQTVLPTLLKQDGTIPVKLENKEFEITGTTPQYYCTSIANNETAEEHETLFNFLLANEREERTYTVECIRIHDSTKVYGGQSVWFA